MIFLFKKSMPIFKGVSNHWTWNLFNWSADFWSINSSAWFWVWCLMLVSLSSSDGLLDLYKQTQHFSSHQSWWVECFVVWKVERVATYAKGLWVFLLKMIILGCFGGTIILGNPQNGRLNLNTLVIRYIFTRICRANIYEMVGQLYQILVLVSNTF